MVLPIVPTITRVTSRFEAERPIVRKRTFTALGTGVVQESPRSAWGVAIMEQAFISPKQREKMPFTYAATKDFRSEETSAGLPTLQTTPTSLPSRVVSVHESGDVKYNYDPRFSK